MLTRNDTTIDNALETYDEVRHTSLQHVGFKDVGIDHASTTELARRVGADGRTLYLEVVSTTEASEVIAAKSAIELGVDYLLGGTRPEAVTPIIAGTSIIYCPFPGTVIGHPSVLEGTFEDITNHAAHLSSLPGMDGVDLLAYRHRDNPERLTATVVDAVSGPVIVAGSIDRPQRIQAVANLEHGPSRSAPLWSMAVCSPSNRVASLAGSRSSSKRHPMPDIQRGVDLTYPFGPSLPVVLLCASACRTAIHHIGPDRLTAARIEWPVASELGLAPLPLRYVSFSPHRANQSRSARCRPTRMSREDS